VIKPQNGGEPVSVGLRERKRRQTKRRIADHAALLFERHGYKNVRMADIAASAEVSEQTLYNYFPTKEHLIFDLDSEYEERIVAIVTAAGPGMSIVQALRQEVRRFLSELSVSVQKNHTLPTACLEDDPAVRRVWIELNARVADSVAGALIRNQKGKIHPAAAKIAARLIVSLFSTILEELGSSPGTGRGRAASFIALKTTVENAIKQIERTTLIPSR
jgi:AcrR family transcriptional regulator